MIQAVNLSKSFSTQVLFENVSFTIAKGERVGLVGRNGSGKTTLFKIILGEESSDSGEVILPKNYRLETLRQHLHFTKPTILEECAQALRKEAEYDQYKVEKMLMGLGFQTQDFSRPPSDFSGGYQIRLNLAKVLLSEPDCLLLDEPTNYLDIVSMRWLSRFLRQFPGEVVLITHDRGFMDEVATHTMGLWRQKLVKIKGDTNKYQEQIVLEEENYEKTRVNQEKKRKDLEDFVTRFKAKASKAAQAQSRMKLLDKMPEMQALAMMASLDFEFQHQECPGKILAEVKDLSFGYGKDLLIKDLSFVIGKADKIGIIGKNGKGKSTLLNLIAGELTPNSGSIKKNVNLLLGHFGQTNINRLDSERTIEEEIASADPSLPLQRVRSICGVMMFGGDLAKKKIKVLSGGERARVLLGKLLARPTNLLLLDEPTNHLDQESVEALTLELQNYPGAVVIVTHSEGILREAISRLVVFHQGRVEYFPHGYNDFLEKIGWEEELVANSKRDSSPRLTRDEQRRLRADLIQERSKKVSPLRKQMEKLEGAIFKMEEEQGELEESLITLASSGDSPKIQEVSTRLAFVRKKVEEDFDLLTEVTSEHDQIMAEFELRLNQLEP